MRVEDTIPEGFDPPELAEELQLTAPGIDPEMIAAAAKRVLGQGRPEDNRAGERT